MRDRGLFALLGFAAVFGGARADVSLGAPFSDGVVLQREKPIPVWGRADAGEKISVSFETQIRTATTTADGRWIVFLDPLPAQAEGHPLTITGKNTITLRDVVVGEVWLCSGQSNMEWPVSRAANAAREIAAANFPLLRQLKIERQASERPADRAPTSGWQSATTANVGSFSAVAYFFARDLHLKLGVPVGVIHSSWGGTAIETWMSELALRSTSLAAVVDERWKKDLSEWPPERVAHYPGELAAWQKAEDAARATKTKNPLSWPRPPATPGSPVQPSALFNGMINPLLPYALRGIVWYQGESNTNRPTEYRELFTALITAWRAHFGQGTPLVTSDTAGAAAPLPFFWVNLPNWRDLNDRSDQSWALLREAQTQALALPNTGQAIAIDLGDPSDLHPPEKRELGRRLALLARNRVYGLVADDTGPTLLSVAREGAVMRVRFTHADAGLVAHEKPVQALELAGADRIFHAADGRLDGNTLIVSSPQVKEPVAVRYAWQNAPEANLYNGAGLPAVPFRSDNW
jgi:sialate O-acetylesterase